MASNPIYDHIKSELEGGELNLRAAKILRALMERINVQGQAAYLTRAEMVRVTDDRSPWQNIGDDPADRKNRLVINYLRERMIPVASSSGQAGYRLELSVEGLEEMRAEMVARRDKIGQGIAKIEDMIERCKSEPIPTPVKFCVASEGAPQQPTQMAFV